MELSRSSALKPDSLAYRVGPAQPERDVVDSPRSVRCFLNLPEKPVLSFRLWLDVAMC